MKYFIAFTLLTLTTDLFSQSVVLPPDSLIKKSHIKTITTYFHNDSTGEDELDCIWKYNSEGNLISSQLFDTEDTTLSIDLYFYKANLLMEDWRIGTWSKYDTIKTTYFYDDKNRVTKEVTTGKFNPFDYKANGFKNSITYNYISDTVTLKKYEGSARTHRGSGEDSLIYNSDKTLKYLFNVSIDLKVAYKYNEQKQLVSETQTSISNPNWTSSYNKYFYDKGHLTKEVVGFRLLREKDKIGEEEYLYINSENGLMNKLIRPLTYDTYKYEYYE